MKLLPIILIILSTGCASLAGNHQLVSVDSDPRGAAATLSGESKPSGITPFYLRMQRVPSERITFTLDGRKQEVTVNCDFRWGVEALGNGVLAVLAPEAALAGVLVDLATGAAFKCPDAITAVYSGRGPSEGSPKSRYCRRFVIAPPSHIDSALSEQLVALWRLRSERALKGCDDFVPPSIAQNVFDQLAISNSDALTLENLDLERLHYLGAETGATHLIVLDYAIVGDEIRFLPKVFDLHRGASVEMPGLAVTAPGGRAYDVRGGAWLASWTFSALPDSITYGYSQTTFGTEGRSPWQDIRQDDPKPTIADALAKVSLTTVDHPQAHSVWDYGFSAYSSIELFSRTSRVYLLRSDGREQNERVTAQYGAPMYHVAATGHTSIGAFQTAVGAGSYIGRMQTGSNSSRYIGGSLVSGEISYTAFLTNTLFVYFGSATYIGTPLLPEPIQELALRRRFAETFARVGYYFPAFRRRLRSAVGVFTP